MTSKPIAKPPGENWTDEQWLGISVTGRSLLVSAAAGSGKTSVLARRCVHLVCDAVPRCGMDELLVVTFTEKAADEMRARITRALRKRAETDPSGYLHKQLALVDQANVSTLHSFCARMLRQHFHLVGLDPGFAVMAGEEASLLRREVARDLFERRYDDEDGEFQRLIDGYGNGQDDQVLNQVLHVHDLLTSVVSPQKWIENSRRRIARAIELPLQESDMGRELLRAVGSALKSLLLRCQGVTREVSQLGVKKYADYMLEISAAVESWTKAFADGGIDALAEAAKERGWGKLPTVKADVPNQALARTLVVNVREDAESGSWRKMLRFSSADWREGLKKMQPAAEKVLDLVEQFGREYARAKNEIRAVDFADLERFTLQALSKSAGESDQPSGAARAFHRRFAHVLVDEFQDINEVQDAILSLVSRECVQGGQEGPGFKAQGSGLQMESAEEFPTSLYADLAQSGPAAPAPSPLYSGERVGVRGDSRSCATDENGPSPQPSPPSTGEREPSIPRSKGFDKQREDHAGSAAPTIFTGPAKTARSADLMPIAKGHLVPNLFCVGDVKQSIYGFRLAEARRFLNRQQAFRSEKSHGRVIDLQANFRSRRPLLDALNCIFSRVMTADAVDIEYDQTHFLLCKTEYPDAENGRSYRGAPIELHLIPDARSPEQHAPDDDARAGEESDAGAQEDDDGEDLTRTEREATLMALEILRIVGKDAAGSPPMLVMDMEEGKKEMSPRPATFRDIVILLRSMQHKADQMAAVLRAHGIDVYAASNAGYFQSMEVRDMLALLTLLDNQRQDIPLAALFRSPLGLAENPETSLACIRSAYSASIPFHEAASRYRAEKTDDLAKELDAFFARLERWRRAAQLRPLADVIWAIYHETGYLTYVAGLEKGEQRVKNLLDLHERSAEFGKFQSRGLSRFMRFIEQLQEETDLGQPSTANEAENVVRIMSVHRSKGLEFPIVFIPDLGKRINMKSAQGPILADRSAGLGMRVVDEAKRCRYPSLAWTLVERRLRQQALAEELRVLYVAMTRAKEHLILIGTAKPKALERWVSDWQDYRGPMPTDAILAATNMLDWIGPVEVMTRTEPTPIFRAIRYSAEDIAAWSTPGSSRRAMSPLQATMAAGKPLPFAPPASEAAQAVIDRISQAYPFARFSDMRATQTVTSATHLPVATPIAPAAAISITNAGVATSVATSTSVTRLPPRPKFLEQAELSATERGTATHLVLQYLDFQAKCDLADIAAQVNSLVSRHILTSSEAAAVDQKAIAWLMADSVGQLLRQGGNVVRRELPVNFPRLGDAEPSKDPLDRVMVRGRIDVLILGDRTATLLDYKTDKVSADNVPTRGDAYGPQLRAYRDAIEMITGLKIDAMYLAFLWPRVMYRLPNEPGS